VLFAALAMRAPVDITTCEVLSPTPALNIGDDGVPSEQSGNELHIRFSNRGAQPITRIVFDLGDGSRVADVGTFAPGVTIDHTFEIGPGDANACAVDSVAFADHTDWEAS
jgi:hypothetical protein